MLVAQGRTACLLGRLNVYPSTQKSSSETSVLSTVLYTRVGGEGVWAGSEGEPETTVLRNLRASYNCTADYSHGAREGFIRKTKLAV